jgi:nitrite reductase/ring-hydroxylating ferredoxin subunit
LSAAAQALQLCEDWAVEPGTMRRIVVQGRRLNVCNVAGRFHVIDDTCTHGFASLSEGTLEGHVVTCPWHGGAFDVRTGQPVAAPCTEALAVHACEVREGLVWVELNRE